MAAMASQITGVSIVSSTVCSGADQRKHQSFASLAFLRESSGDRCIHHKGPVMRKIFPFDDVIISHEHYPALIKNIQCPSHFFRIMWKQAYGVVMHTILWSIVIVKQSCQWLYLIAYKTAVLGSCNACDKIINTPIYACKNSCQRWHKIYQ